MAINSNDTELTIHINGLSEKEKRKLAYLPMSIIESAFLNMKNNIAMEAKKRVQAKIALTFVGGYGNGKLFDSIYSVVEGNTITIKSTESYMENLNKGYGAFDMKKALEGKTVGMRMPGGAVIYRTVGAYQGPSKYDKKKKTYTMSSLGWIHPGYQGKHIYEQVERDMELYVKTYVRQVIQELLRQAGVYSEQARQNSGNFAKAKNNKVYYSKRDTSGRFTPKPQISGPGRLKRTDLMTMNYNTLRNGAIVPNLGEK